MAHPKNGKVLLLMALVLASGFCTYAGTAEAVGFGPYIDYSSGSGSFKWDGSNADYDVDSTTTAIGLSLDSSPTNKSGFNYRLNIAYEQQDIDVKKTKSTMKMAGVALENVFGFSIVRNQDFRWWFGPLVRVGYYTGDTEFVDYTGRKAKADEKLFEFGVGAVTGVNIQIGQSVVLAPSVGVRYIGASGTETYKGYDNDYSGNSTNVFVNFAMMFD